MRNNNLDKMLDSLFDCTNRGENPKTIDLYNKPIVITFDGLSCEIPFNALNYITLTNALAKIAMTKEYTQLTNEVMFDIMALEQEIFNIKEGMNFSTPSEELRSLCDDYSKAMEQLHQVSENLYNLVSDKEYWTLRQEILKII